VGCCDFVCFADLQINWSINWFEEFGWWMMNLIIVNYQIVCRNTWKLGI
jgi:hypothetical protein